MENNNEKLTIGEKLSDFIAKFGGSWHFILTFVCVVLMWLIINLALTEPFDPYPFILLNLLLSCLAALQAPVIMMSQNRQEAKDRKRAEESHEINIRVEKEISDLSNDVKLLHKHLDNVKFKIKK